MKDEQTVRAKSNGKDGKELKFKVAGQSLIGAGKKENQDSFVYRFDRIHGIRIGIAAVADGVGSLAQGHVAGGLVMSELNRWWQGVGETAETDRWCYENLLESLEEIIYRANARIMDYAAEKNQKTATTLSLIFFYGARYKIFHAGDSRIYRIQAGLGKGICLLTQDQSTLVEQVKDGKRILKCALTSCLGYKADFTLFTAEGTARAKEVYLLCSDGIYKRQTEKELCRQVQKKRREKEPLSALCQALIHGARAQGETDDISVIAIQMMKGACYGKD